MKTGFYRQDYIKGKIKEDPDSINTEDCGLSLGAAYSLADEQQSDILAVASEPFVQLDVMEEWLPIYSILIQRNFDTPPATGVPRKQVITTATTSPPQVSTRSSSTSPSPPPSRKDISRKKKTKFQQKPKVLFVEDSIAKNVNVALRWIIVTN